MSKLENGAPNAGAPSSLTLTGMVVAALALSLALYPAGPVVVIRVAGYRTYHWAAEPGQLLVYHYVHSLERVSVFEYLRVEQQGLRVVGARQHPVGAGPPQLFESAGGLIPPAVAARLPELRLLVTPEEKQSLTLGSQHVDLSGQSLGTFVAVRVARAPWLWWRWRRFSS